MNVAANLLAITEEQLIAYFRSKNALSPSTAIKLNLNELSLSLDAPEFLQEAMSGVKAVGVIKNTTDGRLYIDQSRYHVRIKQTRVFILLVFGVIFVGIMLSIVLSGQ